MNQTKKEKLELLSKCEFEDLQIQHSRRPEWYELVLDNSSLAYCLSNNCQLREKPQPKELFVNVFKDGTVAVHSLLAQAISQSEKSNLHYRFKAVKEKNNEYDGCKSWKMSNWDTGSVYIYFNRERMFSAQTSLKTNDNYLLELLYTAPEEVKNHNLLYKDKTELEMDLDNYKTEVEPELKEIEQIKWGMEAHTESETIDLLDLKIKELVRGYNTLIKRIRRAK